MKSIYFLKMVFSYLDDKRKLELIKYNKAFQNKLNINIIYYKLFSRKYLIFETKRKAREYNKENGYIIYEGEYLNGKRNGKGKEKEDDIIYEGEYLNGKRNGKGKEYYYRDETLLFEGEYLNGDRWNGKGYYGNNIIYELKNGKGIIKEYYFFNNLSSILKFEVEYINGKRNGKGKEYDQNGNLLFEGEYLNGKRWNGNFYNEVNNGLKNGKGYIKKYYLDMIRVLRFEGEYLNGEKNGKGKEYDFPFELKFEGNYLYGKRNGKGKEYNKFGILIFEGEFKNGFKSKGREFTNGRLEFEGEYLFNKKWNGKRYDEEGNIICEFKNGKGKAKEYDDYGLLEFEGEYLNGMKWNGKGYKNIYTIIYELNQGKGYVQLKNHPDFNYEGECMDGDLNWKGRIEYPDKRYEGEFANNYRMKDGYGKIYYKNGDIYEGEFKSDQFNGIGIYYFKNGDRYEGEFKDDVCNGIGTYYFYNGGRYEGLFKNGIYDGYGIFYSTSGFRYEGYFKNCLSTTILIISYKALLFLKKIFFMTFINKMTLFLIIILVIGILINY